MVKLCGTVSHHSDIFLSGKELSWMVYTPKLANPLINFPPSSVVNNILKCKNIVLDKTSTRVSGIFLEEEFLAWNKVRVLWSCVCHLWTWTRNIAQMDKTVTFTWHFSEMSVLLIIIFQRFFRSSHTVNLIFLIMYVNKHLDMFFQMILCSLDIIFV